MSSDEDDELAQLRAQRAARLGPAGATLSQLRARQQQAAEVDVEAAAYYDRPPPGQRRHEEDDGPVVVIPEGMEEQEQPELDMTEQELMEANLPVSFGKRDAPQEGAARAPPKFGPSRPPSFGPPKPPSVGPAKPPTMGPPRPPSMGPPRPPAAVAAAAAPADGDVDMEGPPRPPAAAEEEEEDDGMVGPPRPPAGPASDDDEDDDEEDEAAARDPYLLPITQEASLAGADRAVLSVSVEHTGSRVVTGSVDNNVRLYDFNGMKSDMKPFRTLTPHDGHPVLAVSWSPSGDAFLAVDGSSQAKVYDRDGKERGETIRGDMYIRDMRNTKGHISGLTGGCWHPTDKFTAMTCSEDGTIRIWDAWNVLQKTVVKPTTASAARVAVTACAYNSDGRMMAAGLLDGTVQVWNVGGKFGTSAAVGVVLPPAPQMVEKQGWSYVSRSNQLVRGAHEPQTEITCVAFSQDDRYLASRGMDATLKVWDLRQLRQPLAALSNLPTNYATTRCEFSPDQRLLITGTAAEAGAGPSGAGEGGGGGGQVVFVDTADWSIVRRVGMPSHVAGLDWQPRINQIFVGIGDRKSGGCHVLYDPTYSQLGALKCVGRAPRKPSPFDVSLPLMIKTPHALPMFREDPGRKRQREKDRQDPKKTMRPDMGAAAGIGRQGRIGATGGTLLTQHILKRQGKLVGVAEELDPREAILRHANKEDKISALTDAYRKTQPKPIFADPDPDEDEEQ